MFKRKKSDKPSVISNAWKKVCNFFHKVKVVFREKLPKAFSNVKDKICDFFYKIKVAVHEKLPARKSSNKTSKRQASIFYWLILALPLLQFIVFYIIVNANSFALAFRSYTFNAETLTYDSHFAGFDNFRAFITEVFSDAGNMGKIILNSVIICVSSLLVGISLSLIFSYFIYKKMRGSKVFRVFLFLPSIISVIVMVTIFTFFVDFALPAFLAKAGIEIDSPLSHLNTYFITIVIYNLWIGFGTTTLMFSGAMARIPESVIEAGKIDGVGPLREFFCLVLPLIGPTVATFVVTGVAGLFINQANLYAFSGVNVNERAQTIGYYLFIQVMGTNSTLVNYPYASAAGIAMSLIAVPLTLIVKKLLDKYVPAIEY